MISAADLPHWRGEQRNGITSESIGWDTKNRGASVWGFNLNVVYKVPQRPQVTDRRGSRRDYGFTSAPLVHGHKLVVEAGSPDHGNTIAFEMKTGKEIWTSENRQPAGHSGGPVPIMVEGVACAAVLKARQLLVLRLDNGKTVAQPILSTTSQPRW